MIICYGGKKEVPPSADYFCLLLTETFVQEKERKGCFCRKVGKTTKFVAFWRLPISKRLTLTGLRWPNFGGN